MPLPLGLASESESLEATFLAAGAAAALPLAEEGVGAAFLGAGASESGQEWDSVGRHQ